MHSSDAPREALQAAAASGTSRIIAAEALRGVSAFSLDQLAAPGALPRPLGQRDLDNETARAAYALGRRRGFEQGAREGQQQGYTEGSQAFETFESNKQAEMSQQAQALVDSLRAEMAALESRVATDVVTLAVNIARQVLRRELSLDANALVPVASEALRALGEGASHLEVRVNPQDAAPLRRHLETLPAAQAWTLAEDASITRGGCRVEADTGIADATLEARWQGVMASLGRDDDLAAPATNVVKAAA